MKFKFIAFDFQTSPSKFNIIVKLDFFLTGLIPDGQYVNEGFIRACKEQFTSSSMDHDSPFCLPVTWDAAHYLNLAIIDVREGKRDLPKCCSEYLLRFIRRSNFFSLLIGRGKNNAILRKVAAEKKLPLKMPILFLQTKVRV